MAVSGVRARNFIRGGTASSIFAARRGMSAARPARAAAPRGETAKFGKTTGQDFVKFVSGDKNTKAIRSAVNNLKNMLVEGFMAAKSLQASVGNIVGQLKGSGGGRGGRGIGLFGIFAAIAIAVGALLVPKIKEAVKFLYKQVNNIFKFVQSTLRTVYQGLQGFVNGVREFIGGINNGIANINDKVKAVFTVIGQGDNAPAIPELPNLKEDFLPDLKFLEEGYSLDNLLGDTVAGAGNILGGMFGGAKDMFQGMLSGLLGTSKSTPSASPESPASSAAPSASTQGGSSTGNVNEQAFISTVRDLEGTSGERGYETWFGGRNEMDMTKMTLQEVYDEQTRRMNAGETTYNGLSSAAVGAGQFMNPLEQGRAMYAARGETFDPNKIKFDRKFQDELMLDLAKRKRGVDVSKPMTLEGMKILGGEWASFTPQLGQTNRSAQQSLDVYNQYLKQLQGVQPPKKLSSGNVSIINAPGQQIAQAPPRPRPLTSTNPPGGSSSPTVAFYGSSNPDSFDHVLAKATYSVTG